MKKIVAGALALAIASTGLAYAAGHSDAITIRKNGMQAVGLSMGTLGAMAKGEAAFNDKTALSALKAMNYVAASYGNYFPEGSAEGETTAAPKIWEDMDGFKAALAKFEADTANAIANPPMDAAALGAALGAVGGNCKACHETYRIKQ